MDQRIRELQRRARQGDPEARAQLAVELARHGHPQLQTPRPPRKPRQAPLYYRLRGHPLPSADSIQQIPRVSRQDALLVRRLLDGRLDPTTLQIPELDHRPIGPTNASREILDAANRILGGYGVDALALDTEDGTEYTEYVNMGDTYTPTLCLLPNGRFVVASWGDVLEAHERRHGYSDRRGWW